MCIRQVKRSIYPSYLIRIMGSSWSLSFPMIALNMREHRALLTRIFPYKHRIVDSVFTRENMSQRKPVFSDTLRSKCFVDLERYFIFFSANKPAA